MRFATGDFQKAYRLLDQGLFDESGCECHESLRQCFNQHLPSQYCLSGVSTIHDQFDSR
jgi:hypothetical protein